MLWVDYAIVAVIAVSALISLIRGFMRETLSLTALVVAVWVGLNYAGSLAHLLESHIAAPALRVGVSSATLFVVTLVLGGLLQSLIVKWVGRGDLTGTDRLLGVFFGIGRGLILVGLLVLFAGLSGLPADSWWRESRLIPHFQVVAVQIRALLPPQVAQVFVYD